MKLTFKTGNASLYRDGDLGVLINIPKEQQAKFDELIKLLDADYVKEIEIKKKSEKRSLSANSLLWSLLGEMALKLDTTDEELYMDYLIKYSPRQYVGAPREAEAIFKTLYKIVEIVKDCTINTTPAVTFKLIRGSSKLYSDEFAKFLDHIVRDARELGIQTLEDKRILEIVERWIPE